MPRLLRVALVAVSASFAAASAHAQSGALAKAVGGYTFEDAAKEAPDTKNFHSKDGQLTFAIVTHTAGNGFFDPTYVGAKVAADAFGINLVMLGSEAPVDDIPREIEILNQIIQDPTIDGVIMTTPQVGAYNDIVKHMLEQGIPVATTNSFDRHDLHRDADQPYRPGCRGRGDRRRGARQMRPQVRRQEAARSSSRSTTTLGNVEVNNRITAAFQAAAEGAEGRRQARRLQGRRRAAESSASTSDQDNSSARS